MATNGSNDSVIGLALDMAEALKDMAQSMERLARELRGIIPEGSLPLNELEFSIRADNVLLRDMGLRWTHELTALRPCDLLRQPRFGRGSLKEIEELLAEKGMHLR